MPLQVKYDKELNMAYVRDRFHLMDMATVRTVQMECNVDYDKAGNIVGIELFLPATAREETAMSDYTPTTEEVREAYATHRFNAYAKYREVGLPEFDRWLAAHDAKVYQRGREDAERDVFAAEALPFSNLLPRGVAAAAARGDGAE